MTFEEAIKTAIEFEAKVSDVYRHATENTTDPIGKRTFGILAGEEQQHLNYLKDRLGELRRAGRISKKKLDTAIPPRDTIREGISKLEARVEKKDRGTELQLLGKALEVENETTNFYRKMVNELSAEGQNLFARFVEIEEGHLAIVQAEIDYLSKTGYWFDIKEFDME
jgi:rubrerythrin